MFFVRVAIVNKLSCTKYDVLWMSNGDIIKMKRELTSQLLNKVGMCLHVQLVPYMVPADLGLIIVEDFLYLL